MNSRIKTPDIAPWKERLQPTKKAPKTMQIAPERIGLSRIANHRHHPVENSQCLSIVNRIGWHAHKPTGCSTEMRGVDDVEKYASAIFSDHRAGPRW